MTPFGRLVILLVLSISGSNNGLLVNLDDITNLEGIQSGNANADIDFLLQNFKSSLPARVTLDNFHDKYAYDCHLTGLASGIHRNGDAALDITDQKAVFSFGLSTNRLTIECRWRQKVLFAKLSGRVKAYTNRISVRAKISMNLESGSHPILNEFKVTELQKIRTDVSGAGPLNWIGEKILNRRANGAKDKFTREMEVDVAKKLQEKLNKFQLPTF